MIPESESKQSNALQFPCLPILALSLIDLRLKANPPLPWMAVRMPGTQTEWMLCLPHWSFFPTDQQLMLKLTASFYFHAACDKFNAFLQSEYIAYSRHTPLQLHCGLPLALHNEVSALPSALGVLSTVQTRTNPLLDSHSHGPTTWPWEGGTSRFTRMGSR